MKEIPFGIKELNLGLRPGDMIKVSENRKRKGDLQIANRTLTVVVEGPKFITVDTGNYKDTINKIDILQGFIKLERVNEEVESTTKFSKEELKELYIIHKGSAKAIFEALGEKANNLKQVQNAIQNWKIRNLVNAELKQESEKLKNTINGQTEVIEEAHENQTEVDKLLEKAGSDIFNLSSEKGSTGELDRFKKAAQNVAERYSGRLNVKALEGKKHVYTLTDKNSTVIISGDGGEIEIPIANFSDFAAEIIYLKNIYLRRLVK